MAEPPRPDQDLIVATANPEQALAGPSNLDLFLYFCGLGTWGFGGPVALVGYMYRDLVERRRWLSEETYQLAMALAQVMPGPLAAQTAIAIGYFQRGVLGATLSGVAFVLPSFLMVLGISVAYVRFEGLSWMQAIFFGVGAAVIGIIVIAANKLARSTNRRDPLLWSIFAVLAIMTIWAQTELAELFILAGLLLIVVRGLPRGFSGAAIVGILVAIAAGVGLISYALPRIDIGQGGVLLQIFLFFTKAGAFVFGSGLAIVPFLREGVVHQLGWLTERQFLDAVAVAMITPGPVVITVAFIGYLVHGASGAMVAALGIFLPVYIFTVVPAPWFKRHQNNLQLRAFVQGATAAATGAISGSVIVLGKRAIFDQPTTPAVVVAALIALSTLVVLWRFKVPEPVIIAVSAVIGLILWPVVQ